MVAKKRKQRPKYSLDEVKERSKDTIRLVNQVLDTSPVDTAQLRKVASIRGLVNSEVRARAWPVLLGIDSTVDPEEYERVRCGKHRDSAVVVCDVQRSLWSFTEGWSDEEREVKRDALQSILTGVVCSHPDSVFYYQGLHDITSVLLFTAGERAAFSMLNTMVVCHLRDCTRPSLDAVLELLGLLLPLLQQTDEELHAHVEASGVPPFFALSWFITWFAHNVQSLPQISRIFDLLLASHPLMPLYFSAVVMKAGRERILQCDEDPSELHRVLTNLPILGCASADELAQQAVFLFKRCPPKQLLALNQLDMKNATAAEAELRDGYWWVPQKQVPRTGLSMRQIRQGIRQLGKKRVVAQATTAASVGSLIFLSFAAVYISKAWQAPAL